MFFYTFIVFRLPDIILMSKFASIFNTHSILHDFSLQKKKSYLKVFSHVCFELPLRNRHY